jgi:SSS family solute:Na+ symporter
MPDMLAVGAFGVVLGGTSLLALTARWFRQRDQLPALEGWALADRQFGSVVCWFLLGGSIFTAYTFAAVPGLAYGTGAIGVFALPYTIMLCPVLFLLLPKLWTVARRHGHVTVADYVRDRYDSPGLALTVALTGILATMPYIALQVLGIRAILSAGGIYPRGAVGDLMLVAVFAILAGATYRSGLRAPAVISAMKAALIFGATFGVVIAVLAQLGGPDAVFGAGTGDLLRLRGLGGALIPDSSRYAAFASLALGSALALPMYPHVLTAAFAARGPDALRRSAIGLPAWTAVLGMFALFGIAALAAGIDAPAGQAEAAVPLLVQRLMPGLLSGAIFGALAVGALVPAAVMSVAVATLFVRNVYVEYFFPTATPKHEWKVARAISLLAKVGALAFVFGLRNQDAINLQLLGGVWILQTFPAVALGLCTTWLHRGGLLVGWMVGMVTGTVLVVSDGFTSVIDFGVGEWSVSVYVALVALLANLAIAALLTPVLDRRGVPRGIDLTRSGRPRPSAGVG